MILRETAILTLKDLCDLYFVSIRTAQSIKKEILKYLRSRGIEKKHILLYDYLRYEGITYDEYISMF